MLDKFIESVKQAEQANSTEAVIEIDAASAARNFIEIILEARRTGGRNSKKSIVLKTDTASIKNREAVKRHRARKNNLK